MSNTVGYVLLGSSALPAVLGWDLSRRGLNSVDRAAKQAQSAAEKAHSAIAEVQHTIAHSSGEEATVLAQQTSNAVEETNALTTGLGEVSEALKGMTGALAPARVCFALAFVLLLAAFVAFDILSIG